MTAENEEASARLRELIIGELIPNAKQRYIPCFNLCCELIWKKKLAALLNDLRPVKVARKAFSFNPQKFTRPELPAERTVRRMDADLFNLV